MSYQQMKVQVTIVNVSNLTQQLQMCNAVGTVVYCSVISPHFVYSFPDFIVVFNTENVYLYQG